MLASLHIKAARWEGDANLCRLASEAPRALAVETVVQVV